MGAYNKLTAEFECLRCHKKSAQEIEVKFGICDQLRYEIGDQVRWHPTREPQNGGRPKSGKLISLGYCECKKCELDFWVNVSIDEDVIQEVTVNSSIAPYL